MIVVCECKLLNLVDWLSPNVELLKVLLLYVCANDLHGATTQLRPVPLWVLQTSVTRCRTFVRPHCSSSAPAAARVRSCRLWHSRGHGDREGIERQIERSGIHRERAGETAEGVGEITNRSVGCQIPAAAALRRASESAIGNATSRKILHHVTEQPFLPISPLDHIQALIITI